MFCSIYSIFGFKFEHKSHERHADKLNTLKINEFDLMCPLQVRLLMLPSKKQKHKTKIRTGENPQFIESFLLHRVNPEEVNSMGLRVRVYGCERMRRERLIGESIVSFATIDLELETNLSLPLEPRANSTVCAYFLLIFFTLFLSNQIEIRRITLFMMVVVLNSRLVERLDK